MKLHPFFSLKERLRPNTERLPNTFALIYLQADPLRMVLRQKNSFPGAVIMFTWIAIIQKAETTILVLEETMEPSPAGRLSREPFHREMAIYMVTLQPEEETQVLVPTEA